VNFSAARAFSVSSRATSSADARAADGGVLLVGDADTQTSTSAGSTGGSVTGTTSGLGRHAVAAHQLVERDALGAQVVLGRNLVGRGQSKRAWTSRVSVMVAVPTSKLRLADASCSVMAVLLARWVASVSCEASTSK
jgi:hypothetical protein